MEMLNSDYNLNMFDWVGVMEELENADRPPSSEELREAMLDTVEVFNQGNLTEDELKWVLSVLAGQIIEQEFREVLDSFGRGFDERPSFTQYSFKPRRTSLTSRSSRG